MVDFDLDVIDFSSGVTGTILQGNHLLQALILPHSRQHASGSAEDRQGGATERLLKRVIVA